MKTRYDKAVLDVTGISFDGTAISGHCIAHGVTVHHGGPDTPTSVTLTIYADDVEITEELKAFAKKYGNPVTEIHGDDQGKGSAFGL